QVALLRRHDPRRVRRRHDAELRASRIDQPHLAGADVVVDPRLFFDLGYGSPPGTQASATVAATKASSGTAGCAAPSVRGATVPAAASRSPTTATAGTFST